MKKSIQKELKAKIIEMVESYNRSSRDKGTSLSLMEVSKHDCNIVDGEILVKDWYSSNCNAPYEAIQWQFDCGLREPEEDEDDY